MADREGLTFLGSLPIDTQLVDLLDLGGRPRENEIPPIETDSSHHKPGFSILYEYQRTPTYSLFKIIAGKVVAQLVNP